MAGEIRSPVNQSTLGHLQRFRRSPSSKPHSFHASFLNIMAFLLFLGALVQCICEIAKMAKEKKEKPVPVGFFMCLAIAGIQVIVHYFYMILKAPDIHTKINLFVLTSKCLSLGLVAHLLNPEPDYVKYQQIALALILPMATAMAIVAFFKVQPDVEEAKTCFEIILEKIEDGERKDAEIDRLKKLVELKENHIKYLDELINNRAPTQPQSIVRR